MRASQKRFGPGHAAPLLLAVMIGPGCASILGIEDASCDPDVDLDCAGSQSADAGSRNSSDQPGSDEPGGTDAGRAGLLETQCAEYCEALEDNCSDPALRQYQDEQACNEICADYLILATPEDEADGDTLECRLTAADNAGKAEREFNCLVAGLSGGNGCGDECFVYCDLMEFQCPEAYEEQLGGTFDRCVDACDAVPRHEEAFNVDIQEGNTLECRFYHVQAAAGQRELHCPHAAGVDVCK